MLKVISTEPEKREPILCLIVSYGRRVLILEANTRDATEESDIKSTLEDAEHTLEGGIWIASLDFETWRLTVVRRPTDAEWSAHIDGQFAFPESQLMPALGAQT